MNTKNPLHQNDLTIPLINIFCKWITYYFLFLDCFLTISITYISEVCHKKRRGALLNGTQICFAMGAALIYVLNPITSWRSISIVFIIISLSGFLQTFFIPETKYWYLLRGNIDKAMTSLRWYQPDLPLSDADQILRTISQTIEDDSNAKSGGVLELLKNLSHWKYLKPALLGLLVTLLRCGNGRVVFTIYLIDIMRDLEITYDPNTLCTIFGIVEMVGPLLILAVIFKMRRKSVIYLSSAIILICLSVTIAHKFLCNSHMYVIPQWVVVACSYIYTIMVLSAYNTSMSIIVSEIQVAYYRAEITFLLFGIMCFFFWMYAFLYPYAEKLFPIEYILSYFTANIILALILIIFFFPETSRLEFYENSKITKKSRYTRFK